jgi:uncharacterized DUF497 family protein
MERFAGFDWDSGNRSKCQKHGVSIDEIELILSGGPRIAPDIKHSDLEDRYVAVGRGSRGKPVFVVFVYRIKDGQQLIRPVSARYMHSKEAERYGQESH